MKKKFLKYLSYAVPIVIYSIARVLLRYSGAENWVFWVISIALVALLSLASFLFSDEKGSEDSAEPVVKEEGRYYFYADHCSFKLAKEDIVQDNTERNGMKHSLMTNSMALVILEIRSGMPDFPSSIPTKNLTIAGFPSLAAKVNPLSDEYSQYFINCKDYVVQVSMSIVSEDFLNSFRKEK